MSSDLEKKTKLSFEMADPETGFQEVSIPPATPVTSQPDLSADVNAPGMQPLSQIVAEFELSSDFWQSIHSDPVLREDLEHWLQAKLKERVEKDFESEKKKYFEEARQEGLKRGLEDARPEASELCKKLDVICAQVLTEKETLLHAHEICWGRALGQLLRRFLVPCEEEITEQMAVWLSESLSGFPKKNKVVVRVSGSEFDSMSNIIATLPRESWELKSDSSLKKGEVQCDCEDGGVFFSSEEGLKKLDDWIAQFSSKGSRKKAE